MRSTDVPIVAHVRESGPNDRVYDALLLSGPLVIVVIAALGRTLPTRVLAVSYIVLLVVYILLRGVQEWPPSPYQGG